TSADLPLAASPPVSAMPKPMRMGSAAWAVVAVSASAETAVSKSAERRVNVPIIVFLPCLCVLPHLKRESAMPASVALPPPPLCGGGGRRAKLDGVQDSAGYDEAWG